MRVRFLAEAVEDLCFPILTPIFHIPFLSFHCLWDNSVWIFCAITSPPFIYPIFYSLLVTVLEIRISEMKMAQLLPSRILSVKVGIAP